MNQIRAGVILNYVIIILNILLGLLYTPYMLRMLGKNEYGLYSLVASIIAYLTILDCGLGNAIVRYTAKFKLNGENYKMWNMFGMILILYLFIGLLTVLLGGILYYNVDSLFAQNMSIEELEKSKVMILLLIFNLALTFPLSIFGSIITAYEDFIFQRVLTIIRLLISSLVIVALLSLGYKSVAMVVTQTIFNILFLVINCVYCFYKLKIKVRFGKIDYLFLKEILMYSFWVFLSVMIDRFYWSTGQFVIGKLLGTAAVAIFSVAILLQQMYMTFSSSISNVLLPKVTSLVSNGDNNDISNFFIKTGRLQCIVMTLILFGFFLFGKDFIRLWAGEEYIQSYYIALIFFIGLYTPTIQSVGYTILQARNKMKFRSLCYLIISIFSLFFQYYFTIYYGVIGCGLAIGGALLLGQGLIMNIYYDRVHHLKIALFWKNILNYLKMPLILTFVVYLCYSFISVNGYRDLFLLILIYVVLYSLSVYFFSLNSYERQLVGLILNKIVPRK